MKYDFGVISDFIPENHVLKGGTFAWRFSENNTKIAIDSVKELNDANVWLSDNQLHTSRNNFDLSDFWIIYRSKQKD